MKNKDFINKLSEERYFNFNIVLGVIDKLTEESIKSEHLEINIPENSLYVGAREYYEIKVGMKFNALFTLKTLGNFQKIDVEIIKVSVRRDDNIDTIHIGYSGICLLKFNDKIPEIFNDIAIFNGKYDISKNDRIYLASEDVAKDIAERYKQYED